MFLTKLVFAGAKFSTESDLPTEEEIHGLSTALQQKAAKLISQNHRNLYPEEEQITRYYNKAMPQTNIKTHTGDLLSQVYLSRIYIYGEGVPKDLAESAYWTIICAAKGVSECQNRLGLLYSRAESGLKPNPRFEFLLFYLAAKNFLPALQNVGFCYQNGVGVKKNLEKSFKFLKMAADKDSTESQFWVGEAYLAGHGVKKDRALALYYFKLAAEKGDKKSKEKVAFLSDEECSICLEKICEQQKFVATCCCQSFHNSCIKKWQEKSYDCPLCRGII